MARDGYLILDGALHMREPEDLWARYLAAPYRANPPRFFGAQQQQLAESSADKANADTIEGMVVQGLAIPAHGKSPGAAASRRELRRKSRAAHPHFDIARARGFDPISTLTAMDIEGIDVAVMYGTRGRQILCHDDLPADYAPALGRAYNDWAADYCKTDPQRLKFAAQIAMHDVPTAVEEARRCVKELGAVAVIGTPTRSMVSICTTRCASRCGTRSSGSTCRSGFIRPARRHSRTMPGLVMSVTPISPDRPRYPQPGRADGGACQSDQWRRARPSSETPLRLSRRDGGLALLVAVAARRPVGEVRPGLRAPDLDAADRLLPAPVLCRARRRRGAGRRRRQQARSGILCRVFRLPAFRRRLSRGDPAISRLVAPRRA